MQTRSQATLEKIIAAAKTLIAREGINALTMEAVAEAAGISKGGVLHHFRSKEALLAELVSRELEADRRDSAREMDVDPGAPRRALLGILRAGARHYAGELGFPPALLAAAIGHAPCVAAISAAMKQALDEAAAEAERPDEARALLFACWGLQMFRTLGFEPLADDEASRVFRAIEQMARRGE